MTNYENQTRFKMTEKTMHLFIYSFIQRRKALRKANKKIPVVRPICEKVKENKAGKTRICEIVIL